MVKATGILAHHFHGNYWASVGLEFQDEASAHDAVTTLGGMANGWKIAKNQRVLVWSGQEPREPSEFERACAEIGLTCESRYLGEEKEQDRWTVTLKLDGRTIETPYSAGFGHRVKLASKANPPAVVRQTPAERMALDGFARPKLDGMPYNPREGRPVAPSAASVLACLLLDAESVENANGFEDWASSLGYDADSRTAEKTYREFPSAVFWE